MRLELFEGRVPVGLEALMTDLYETGNFLIVRLFKFHEVHLNVKSKINNNKQLIPEALTFLMYIGKVKLSFLLA